MTTVTTVMNYIGDSNRCCGTYWTTGLAWLYGARLTSRNVQFFYTTHTMHTKTVQNKQSNNEMNFLIDF